MFDHCFLHLCTIKAFGNGITLFVLLYLYTIHRPSSVRMQSQPVFLLFLLLLVTVPLLILARALPGKGQAVTTPRHSNKNQKGERRSSKHGRYPSAAKNPKKTPIVEFLKKVQEQGYAAYQEAVARGSSTFESACIKACRPNDDPAKEKYVSAIVAAVNDFDEPKKRKQKNKASREEEVFDPYQVTCLHHPIQTIPPFSLIFSAFRLLYINCGVVLVANKTGEQKPKHCTFSYGCLNLSVSTNLLLYVFE